MSIATKLTQLLGIKADIKDAINQQGQSVGENMTQYASAILAITGVGGLPATLPENETTVNTDETHTAVVLSNDNCRIKASNGQKYTIAEWNALFVAAGYDKDNMDVVPIGIALDAFDHAGETYLFDKFDGITYNPVGDGAGTAGNLQLSIYNHIAVTGAASGTDFTTGKNWAVTVDGDELVLSEENTGQTWRISKDTGFANAHKVFNITERTHSMWAQTEWMRHRMAIDSGLTTTLPDGTIGQIEIFNASGEQAAVNEDMYFWVRATQNDSWVNTNKLAKYNLNNRHDVNSASLTQAIADIIYDRQIANGINMNDTGVNSESRPILAPGSKGAEVIAVNGKWMIITPYISNPSATTATATNNMSDSPAVYWAKSKGYDLPSDTLIDAMYFNLPLCIAMRSYLVAQGWNIPALPNGNTWTAGRYSATNSWYVSPSYGLVGATNSYTRYLVVGASAS